MAIVEDNKGDLTPLEKQCVSRLRQLRRERGWTLGEVETISGGEIKSVVLGSYERGTRAISMARLQQLSDFYGVPIEYFLIDSQSSSRSSAMSFDLRRIREYRGNEIAIMQLRNLLATIVRRRGDWRGEVVTLRASDLESLSAVLSLSNDSLREIFKRDQLLLR